eukprot:TRINITY_DN511_c0_g1_i1.p1 TRINITY_DN511_c0_g1~~TRINITY_DN511_c0_g1_i1.p1  ORF type:complete len:185 (+),score=14.18 TRINITY_DN511_c0_g1_i1:113-667(+)
MLLIQKIKNIVKINNKEIKYQKTLASNVRRGEEFVVVKKIIDLILYYHSKNIAIINLSLDSFALDEDDNIVLISNTKKFKKRNQNYKINTKPNTIWFQSPEVNSANTKAYNPFQANMYSLGVIIFYLLEGHYPYGGSGLTYSKNCKNGNIQLESIENKYENNIYEVIKNMTKLKPCKREINMIN